MKKIVSLLLAFSLMAGLLAGCGGGNANNDDQSEKTTIDIAITSDITTLDPQNHNNFITAYTTRHLYSNLITLDENGEFVGDLLASFEYADPANPVDLKCTLKDGITFHNGETMTSEDVKFSFDRLKSQMVSHLITAVDSVEVVNEKEFIIHLTGPDNNLFGCLYHPGAAILCKSYVESLSDPASELASKPNGSGPFKFVERKVGSSITLEKFEGYFDASRAAQSEGITFLVTPETSAKTIALEAGDVDMVIDLGTADAEKIEANEKCELSSVTSTKISYITFNTQKAPFNDPLVRQALNYAVNKENVLTVAMDGQGELLNNYISPSALGYYDITSDYTYDLEKAKSLLADAGYNESNPLTFEVAVATDVNKKGATVIQAELLKIGVDMQIKSMESSALYADAKAGTLDAAYIGWGSLADPGTTYNGLYYSKGASNYAHYNNPEVDALIADATTNADAAAVDAAYQKVLQTLNDDAMWIPLYTQKSLIAYNKDLQGVHNSAIGLHNFYGLHY
ncbi:MAG: ABC transporter substrate-binding protein [Lachnospiraceae bacterium]|nr:ABC transporter substrate-binding protein [Lachnospiraceae bacterium]